MTGLWRCEVFKVGAGPVIPSVDVIVLTILMKLCEVGSPVNLAGLGPKIVRAIELDELEPWVNGCRAILSVELTGIK